MLALHSREPTVAPNSGLTTGIEIMAIIAAVGLFVAAITLAYLIYFDPSRRRNHGAAPSRDHQLRGTPVLDYGSRPCPGADGKSPATVALIGVWMSTDINPKLIHRVSLADVDPKTLEQYVDKHGFLYVFSDPEMSYEEPSSTCEAALPGK